jgi:hypothetical protein
MERQIKILHVSPEYEVMYFIIINGVTIKSLIPIEQAIDLAKKEQFDLILSEPQNLAILTPRVSA